MWIPHHWDPLYPLPVIGYMNDTVKAPHWFEFTVLIGYGTDVIQNSTSPHLVSQTNKSMVCILTPPCCLGMSTQKIKLINKYNIKKSSQPSSSDLSRKKVINKYIKNVTSEKLLINHNNSNNTSNLYSTLQKIYSLQKKPHGAEI